MKVIVLLSGGLDSVTALYHTRQAHDVVATLSFHYGAKHNDREIPFARLHSDECSVPHITIPLHFIAQFFESDLLKKGGAIPEGHYEEQSMRQTVVPFRNGIMLSIAAGIAESRGADGIVIAAHAGDHAIYPDCRTEFMDAQANAIRLGTYQHIELIRPFISMTKSDIVRTGTALDVDYADTWSCYVGEKLHCGRCGTCVERREAFIVAGIPDPTKYQFTDPLPPRPTQIPSAC